MNFSEKIIREYREDADKRVAFVCRLMIGFMVLVALLNILGIFKIAPLPLYLTVAVSSFDFFLPTFFYDILKPRSTGLGYFILAILFF